MDMHTPCVCMCFIKRIQVMRYCWGRGTPNKGGKKNYDNQKRKSDGQKKRGRLTHTKEKVADRGVFYFGFSGIRSEHFFQPMGSVSLALPLSCSISNRKQTLKISNKGKQENQLNCSKPSCGLSLSNLTPNSFNHANTYATHIISGKGAKNHG